jgi:putative ABC transport system permease protein
VPYRQRPSARMGVVVRTAADPQSVVLAARQAVLAVDKDQPVYGVKTMNELMDEALFGQRLSAGMMGVLALVALALAVVGIYGVVAYGVTQRTHEIGIRMALGAKTGDILRLVLRQGMRPVAIGLAIGIAGAFGVSRLLTHALFDMNASDPATFAATPALLAAAALVAIYVPARRATRVEPMKALRID